jgi:hypothetical protein
MHLCRQSVVVLNTAMYVRKKWNIVFCLTLWERNVCEKGMYRVL